MNEDILNYSPSPLGLYIHHTKIKNISLDIIDLLYTPLVVNEPNHGPSGQNNTLLERCVF